MDSASATERFLAAALAALAIILPVSIAGANIALALVTAALLAHMVSGRPLAWRAAWTPEAWCLCLYLAVAALTSLTSVLPARSLHNLPKDIHKLWVFFVLLLALRAADTRRLPAAMAAGFIFIASYGIARSCWESLQVALGPDHVWGWGRVHAFVISVTFGEMTAFGLLGGLAFLAQREAASRRSLLVFIALLAAALLLNKTRGAFLGVLAGLGAMCAAQPALRRWIKWGLAVAVLAVGVSFWRNYGNAQFTRLHLWDVAWRVFKDHPLFGVGPANYATVFTDYFPGIIEGQRVWGSAHNIYLQQLAERGLVGLVALLALGSSFLARSWQQARRVLDAANLLALAATTAFIVMNLTESAFQNEQITTLFLAIWAYTQSRALDAEGRRMGATT